MADFRSRHGGPGGTCLVPTAVEVRAVGILAGIWSTRGVYLGTSDSVALYLVLFLTVDHLVCNDQRPRGFRVRKGHLAAI